MQHFLDFLNTSMENGEMTLSVFIDFKKAFDTVDFKILIDRIRSLGVTGSILKWFESYLIGRSIRVCFDDVISNKFFISCGVLQGSVLGPLLYLVYVDTRGFMFQVLLILLSLMTRYFQLLQEMLMILWRKLIKL